MSDEGSAATRIGVVAVTWNYRVMKHESEHGDWLGVHEVYYDEDGTTIMQWSTEPIRVSHDTLDEIREDLGLMLKSLDKPVIDYAVPSSP